MKTRLIFHLSLLSVCFGAYGQNQGGMPIKVLANEHTTTTIFFPSGIAKTIAPAANFTFEYQDEDTSIGLLKGGRGRPSNVTVITENGYIYSFALQYSQNIETFNFMLSTDMAVGRTPNGKSRPASIEYETAMPDGHTETADQNDITSLEPVPTFPDDTDSGPVNSHRTDDTDSSAVTLVQNDDSSPEFQTSSTSDVEEEDEWNTFQESENNLLATTDGEGDLYDIDREEYYRIYCENNYLQKTILMRTFRQNKRIVLKLNNILVDREEIYFVLQVENDSRKEYQVNGLSFFRKTGVGQLQKIMKPLYTFNLQDKIDPQSINEVVFVFKRFTISNKEEVYVVLDELENDRMVMLPLDDKQINAPTN